MTPTKSTLKELEQINLNNLKYYGAALALITAKFQEALMIKRPNPKLNIAFSCYTCFNYVFDIFVFQRSVTNAYFHAASPPICDFDLYWTLLHIFLLWHNSILQKIYNRHWQMQVPTNIVLKNTLQSHRKTICTSAWYCQPKVLHHLWSKFISISKLVNVVKT